MKAPTAITEFMGRASEIGMLPPNYPIERLWEEVKKQLNWESFGTLDELREFIRQRLEKLNTSIVASITGWDFILDALFVSGFS